MALNLKGFVSWGMYAPSSTSGQRANLFATWGLDNSLPSYTLIALLRGLNSLGLALTMN